MWGEHSMSGFRGHALACHVWEAPWGQVADDGGWKFRGWVDPWNSERLLIPTFGKRRGEQVGFLFAAERLLLPTFGKCRGEQVGWLFTAERLCTP
jgi:hypothetical protein